MKQLLGALPLELALGAVLSGADVLAALLPALATALASGGLPPAAASSGCADQLALCFLGSEGVLECGLQPCRCGVTH